jgi:hypothetical protein
MTRCHAERSEASLFTKIEIPCTLNSDNFVEAGFVTSAGNE